MKAPVLPSRISRLQIHGFRLKIERNRNPNLSALSFDVVADVFGLEAIFGFVVVAIISPHKFVRWGKKERILD